MNKRKGWDTKYKDLRLVLCEKDYEFDWGWVEYCLEKITFSIYLLPGVFHGKVLLI